MKFDIDKLFEQTKRAARQYSQQVSGEQLPTMTLCT